MKSKIISFFMFESINYVIVFLVKKKEKIKEKKKREKKRKRVFINNYVECGCKFCK